MDKVFEILEKLIPLEIAALIVIFLWFLKAFKDIASNFQEIAYRQIEYLNQRVSSVDKTTEIFERTVDHQENDLKRLYEANESLKNELEKAKEEARKAIEEQYEEILSQQETDKANKSDIEALRKEIEAAKSEVTADYDLVIQKLESTEQQTGLPRKPESCFVLMPMDSAFSEDLYSMYSGVLAKYGISATRIDGTSYNLTADIRQAIKKADFIIADISGNNANVMYELGFAHGSEKPVIMLTHSKDRVPFDLANIHVFVVDNNPSSIKQFCERLEKAIPELTVKGSNELIKEVAEKVKELPYSAIVNALLKLV